MKTYTTPSGDAQVIVGSNARENDRLTFQMSQSNDLWLHAKDAAGAHVLLRSLREGGRASQDDMEFAARLAALNSQMRTMSRVEVSICSIMDVRKPKRAPAGTVEIENDSTLMVSI